MTDPRTTPEVTWELLGAGTPDVREAPIVMVRRVLRGRLRLIAIIAVVLGTLGAIAGYHAKPPRFVSQGLVRIDGALTPILYNTDENRVPPMFESFVAAQEVFLGSRAVLDDAVASPELQDTGWPSGEQGVVALQRGLKITRGRKENLIAAAVTDRDARRAQAAVNAVLAAFEANVVDPTSATTSLKERTLIERQGELERRIRLLREEVIEISQQYGSEAVNRLHAARVKELLSIEEKIAALDLASESGTTSAESAAIFLPEASQRITDLEDRESDLVARLASLREHYGPGHSIIARLEQELDTIRIQRDLSRQPLAITDTRLEDLRRQYITREAVLRSDIERLGRQLVEIAEIEARIRETGDLLWATRRRLDEIRVESTRDDMNRITIAARGDLPVSPISDRRVVLTAAGLVFGCFAAGATVFLIGVVDPRARYLEEVRAFDAMAPVLGAIPDIDAKNPERASAAVHQLRNLLELQASDPARNVFAVTSAERGEGRTSLSLALASSFAAAGRRTLVIDADLGRAALSREFGLEGQSGLCDALADAACVKAHPTDRSGVHAMPAGSRRGFNAAGLSHTAMRTLFDGLRPQYDAIVVDTGPVLDSAETCAVCAACDGVVMTVARGRRLARTRAAFDRLGQVNVACAGLVLNRAHVADHPSGGERAAPATRLATLVAPVIASAATDDPAPPHSIPFIPNEAPAGERKKAA